MNKKFFFGIILMVLFSFGCFTPIEPNPPIKPNTGNTANGGTEPKQDGLSFETAVIIQADNEDQGVPMEYDWLTDNACLDQGGPKERTLQDLEEFNDSLFDVLYVECNNGEEIKYYFNIDSFFGKWGE